jgi:hypothetical protein
MAKHRSLWRFLDEYFQVLESGPLADKSVEDYYYFAECFVRWVDGDFTPGGNPNLLHNHNGTTRRSLTIKTIDGNYRAARR